MSQYRSAHVGSLLLKVTFAFLRYESRALRQFRTLLADGSFAPLDHLDLDPVGILQKCDAHRARSRRLKYLDVALCQLAKDAIDIAHTPAHVIDCVSHAGRRITLDHQQPHPVVAETVELASQFPNLAAEFLCVPREHGGRI